MTMMITVLLSLITSVRRRVLMPDHTTLMVSYFMLAQILMWLIRVTVGTTWAKTVMATERPSIVV